jgi:transcriptional regulator with XRE-family HTH domain
MVCVAKGGENMAIGDAVLKYRQLTNTSQLEVAMETRIDRGSLSKMERGVKSVPDIYDADLSNVHYSIALEVAEERTNNFVPNVLDDGPEFCLYPSAIKERVMESLRALTSAYDSVPMYGPVISQALGKKLWHANRKALEWLLVNQGKIEEQFKLNGKQLAKEHEQINKREEEQR